MTTRRVIYGNEWTLIAQAPIRVLLQAQGGAIHIQLATQPPDPSATGFRVKMDDWADFVNIDDFGANVYAKADGRSAIIYYVSS